MQPAVAETFSVPPTVSAAAGISLRGVRSSALAFSVAAHLALVGVFLLTPAPAPKEPEPLVRLVFAEPPLPPPPPLAAAAPVERPAAVVPKPRPKRVAKKPVRKALAPVPVAKPIEPTSPIEPADEAPEPPAEVAGEAAGAGVVGGPAGGTVGGVAGGRGDRPIPVGQVARPPVLVEQVKPRYPPAARRRGIEGLVRLEAVLDTKGRIEAPIRVLESIPELDDAAIVALRDWRFAPARDHGGEAVRVILEVPIRFVLR